MSLKPPNTNKATAPSPDSVPAHQDRHEFQIAVVNAIIESMPDGILVVNTNTKIISVNSRFFEIWDIPHPENKEDLPDHNNDKLLLSQVVMQVKDPETFVARVKQLYDNPSLNDFTEIPLKDDRTLERHSTVLRGDEGQYLGRVWFFRDITAHKLKATALKELAYTDPLTGIPNRRFFQEQSHDAFITARRLQHSFSLIIIDVDNFKEINDKYGHPAGDAVLKALCRIFSSLLREVDMLGRIGGDEFAIMLPGSNVNGACATAERLRSGAEQLIVTHEDHTLRASITGGIASMKKDDYSVEDILKRADEALYRAKQNGRNRIERDD